ATAPPPRRGPVSPPPAFRFGGEHGVTGAASVSRMADFQRRERYLPAPSHIRARATAEHATHPSGSRYQVLLRARGSRRQEEDRHGWRDKDQRTRRSDQGRPAPGEA